MAKFYSKSFKKLFRFLYVKFVRINDTPQKVSLGLALGVLLGLIPGTGPVAAITLAIIFRLNKFAALMGSLVTNTWLSIALLIPAIKLGARILNLKWTEIYRDWRVFLIDFRWSALFKISVYKIILPVLVGYVTMGLLLAVLVYLVSVSIIIRRRHEIKV